MPRGQLMIQNFVGSFMEIAGWGVSKLSGVSNKMSTVLLHVRIPIIDKDKCREIVEDASMGPGQFCAGGDEGFDSCRGDSGGPVMRVESFGDTPRYYIVGLVSFGPRDCGTDKPAIYTDVTKYKKWILDHIQA
ncbi:hypothetical protein Zmor_005585 [Zophobas morio]|uniref:Peptidase S1 domain-containing protein n=1 Tax=Zophobas morio TaxID=2755281 RepID=A0AA38M8J9_9CUCU|nr:hypothetical protein Zmor_019300 [Zophobas morio]KAJ3661176.1 hypothetical protein Zmor_005585 [Zophobas morio]